MAIEITLIVGPANSGKSTLARSLSGIGQNSNLHPSTSNIVTLNWRTQNLETLVIHSSLNEMLVLNPPSLGTILDDYETYHGVERAILCISTSVKNPLLQQYSRLFSANAQLSNSTNSHILKHVVRLRGKGKHLPNFGAWPIPPLPVQKYIAQNLVAKTVAGLIGL